MLKTNILVSADITIRIRETGKEEDLRVDNIPCLWVWADGSRGAAEYWAVSDWIAETFGNNIDWFSIKCVVGTPVREGDDPMKQVRSDGMDVLEAMTTETEVQWGTGE